jgi:predicted regulator of Ras-like GTPase activity (Roadblock/LC7/MglB family)
MRHLPLGSWRSISCECEDANLAIAPSDDDGVILVAAAPGIPIGFVRRVLDHAAQRVLTWREEVA